MMRHCPAAAIAAAFTISLLLPSLGFAASTSPGRERAETLVATFKKVKKDDGKLTEADKAANAKVFAELDTFLDFETLVSKPIAPRADKLKPEELAGFKAKFRELIRLVAYPNSGAFFREATLSFQPEQARGELLAVAMKVRLPAEDLDTVVEFLFAKVGGALKVQDVLFEGDSLVKDYQNQITKVIDKSGIAGLMKILDDRLADLSKAKK
ncbi:MAG: ABC transporter substrate-binding protein [Deltaproteobacteria bacterium]|nr:ABC transporter substrate-binding protein [Deltaproteobacteria bacterium]